MSGMMSGSGNADRDRREVNRRSVLYGLGASLGSVALTALLADEQQQKPEPGPLAPKQGHFPAQAKHCIFL
ncbi:MAG: hypothetical protein KDA58_11730, partial [Planctomycetaceae bacterium]|nr:hypothetical protein [Planctomycetaceae bacterium]